MVLHKYKGTRIVASFHIFESLAVSFRRRNRCFGAAEVVPIGWKGEVARIRKRSVGLELVAVLVVVPK